MKPVAVLCILCIVVISTVSADTISPGTIQGIRLISTIDPHKISINQPQTTLMGMLSVTSTPLASTVLIDGSSTLYGAPIPLTDFSSLAIVSGSHTITVKHAGYVDYSATFSVNPGGTASVNAQLQPLKIMMNQLNPAVVSGAVARNIEGQAIAAGVKTPATSVPTPTPTLLPCPSGYLCESLAAAQSAYGADGYTQYGTLPCNYTTARAYSKEQVKEYCIKPQRKVVGRITLNTNIVEPAGAGQNPVGIFKPVPVLPVPAVHSPLFFTHVAVVDKFLDSIAPVNPGSGTPPDMLSSIFARIFGKPVSQQSPVPADICVCGSGWVCTYAGDCNCHVCNGQCVDLQADKTNCGSCGMTCPADYNCWKGECFWDVGRCGTPADCDITRWPISPDIHQEWQCVNTYCTETCKAGYMDCNTAGLSGYCTDILNNDDQCGSCNHYCGGGYTCRNGVCVATFN